MKNHQAPTELDAAIRDIRLNKAELKKAYALAITNNSVDKYQVLRSLIAMGNVKESQQLLQELECHNPDFYLEMARIHNMEGSWEETLKACELGMKLEMTPLYMMTYLQVSSIAHYELGQLEESLVNINKIESLAHIQDAPTVVFYNKLLKIKVEQLLYGNKKENQEIQNLLNQIISNNLLNLDTLLAWLRCKIDLMRMQKLPHAQYTNAAIAVVKQLGDQLYLDLALLDHQIASHDSNGFNSSFIRVRKIASEALSETQQSTTARLMNEYLRSGKKELRQKNMTINEGTKTIVISDINLSINLDPFSFHFHTPREKSINALKVLYRGDTSKDVFFKYLWNHQYSDHLHNNLIRTLISRLRTTFSVEIKSSKSVLSLKNTIVC